MKVCIIILAFILLFVACNQNTDNTKLYTGKLIPYDDSIFPEKMNTADFLNTSSNLIGLPRLDDNHFDKQIRVWIWELNKNYIIDLRTKQGKSKVDVYKISSIDSAKVHYIRLDSAWQNVKPINGWKNFEQKIEELHVIDLRGEPSPKIYLQL